MMLNSRLQRKFLRAPLKSIVLYIDGEHVLKGKAINVSEGGILLSDLPHIPEHDIVSMAIDLVEYPTFNGMSLEKLKCLVKEDFHRTILKTNVKIVRSFENKTNVELVFASSIGCEFFNIASESKATIFKYIETFTKNTVYLLSLFESLTKRNEQLEVLRVVSQLLGYDHRMKIPLLRAKVLHDYQSLESL